MRERSWKLWQDLERTACKGAGYQVVSIVESGPNMTCTVTVIIHVYQEVRNPFSHGDESFFFFLYEVLIQIFSPFIFTLIIL